MESKVMQKIKQDKGSGEGYSCFFCFCFWGFCPFVWRILLDAVVSKISLRRWNLVKFWIIQNSTWKVPGEKISQAKGTVKVKELRPEPAGWAPQRASVHQKRQDLGLKGLWVMKRSLDLILRRMGTFKGVWSGQWYDFDVHFLKVPLMAVWRNQTGRQYGDREE